MQRRLGSGLEHIITRLLYPSPEGHNACRTRRAAGKPAGELRLAATPSSPFSHSARTQFMLVVNPEETMKFVATLKERLASPQGAGGMGKSVQSMQDLQKAGAAAAAAAPAHPVLPRWRYILATN